jgi:transcriptional regulator with XRE-family HTH domain
MQIPLTSVQSAGVAIRALRKRAGIRIDDFALTAGVSKQFMTDLENGKDTVRMGSVLNLLQRLGIRVSLDLPEEVMATFQAEFDKVTHRRSRKSASSALPAKEPCPASVGGAHGEDSHD